MARNVNFYERKKETIIKTWTFHKRKSSYYECLDKRNVDIMDFWEEKEIFFNGGSWKKDLFWAFTKLACFKDSGRWSFSSQENNKMIFS